MWSQDTDRQRLSFEVDQQLLVMVGDGFHVCLTSEEEKKTTVLEVSCLLRDRSHPLLDDTIILSLESGCGCLASPTSPVEGDMTAKVAVAKADSLSVGGKDLVNFCIQASSLLTRWKKSY